VRSSTRRLLAALAVLPLFAGAPAPAAAPLEVFVSVAPLQWLIERLGGERVEARVLVPPGRSPATYDPSPRQMTALAGADLYVRVGVPFERAWMPRITAANPDMAVMDLRGAVVLRSMAPGHVHGPPRGQGDSDARDPHIWTSPPNLIAMAELARDRLKALDPAGGPSYDARHARLVAELQGLDRQIRALLADVHARRFLVFHPSWGYFADRYALEQLPVEREGKVPGPRALGGLIEEARRAGIRLVIVQPQFSQRAARTVAEAIGARLVVVDPLAYDVPGSLLQLARAIAGGGP
jgi:zinc transport system substrate-binding protein